MTAEYEEKVEVEIVTGSPRVQMLVVPKDKLQDAKDAVRELVSGGELFDEDGDNGGGDEKTLPSLSGTGCRRTRRRDILCADED